MPTTKTFKTTASLVGAHADGCRSECGKLKPRRGCFESDGRAIRRVGASFVHWAKSSMGYQQNRRVALSRQIDMSIYFLIGILKMEE